MERRIEYRQLVNILALFFIVQLMGLLVTFLFLTPSQVVVVPSSSAAATVGQAFIFLSYIVISTVVLLIVFRLFKGALIFSLIEAVVVISAAFYLFAIILGGIFPQDSAAPYVIAVSILIPVLLVIAKSRRPGLRNAVAILASTGAGIVLGSFFSFASAYFFMAIIAAYDYIAVFITKHMLALGKEAVQRNLAMLVGSSEVEIVPESYMKSREAKAIRKQIDKKRIGNKQVRYLIGHGGVPLPTQAALGTGDLAVPLMLAVSAYLTYLSFFTSLVIMAGAAVGLVFTMYLLKKYAVGLPAIPPLFAFVSIALGLEFLLGGASLTLSLSLFAMGVLILYLIVSAARNAMKKEGTGVFK